MGTPIQLPDSVYDRSHVWQNASDRVSYERTFQQDPIERGKIVVALDTANPEFPEQVIRERLATPPIQPRFGIPQGPPDIDELFSRNLGHVQDFAPTNFSGQQGGFSGTATPAVPPW